MFSPSVESERRRVEPETIVVALAWVISLAYVIVGIAGGSGFGPDRAIALAFAIGMPLLAGGARARAPS